MNLTASNLSYTTQFPFDLAVVTPGNGNIALKGQAGPLNQTDMQQTPLNATLEARNLNLAATGFVEPASGIAGLVDFSGTLASDGKTVTTKGTATASKLQLAPGASPATQPVQLAYQTDYLLAGQNGVLRQGDVRVGKALAQLTGTYKTTGQTTSVQMKLKGSNMPATDISSLLPALGVILPAGAALKEGTLNMDLNLSGPLDRLVTTGPVNLSNAKMTGFDLGSKMKVLATFAGIPSTSDTLIQTMASDLRLDPAGIRADNFNLVVPSIGSLTGNGTINSKQEAQFQDVGEAGEPRKLARRAGQSRPARRRTKRRWHSLSNSGHDLEPGVRAGRGRHRRRVGGASGERTKTSAPQHERFGGSAGRTIREEEAVGAGSPRTTNG